VKGSGCVWIEIDRTDYTSAESHRFIARPTGQDIIRRMIQGAAEHV